MKRFWSVGALFLLLTPLLWLIFQPGFWVSDDGTWMVVRLAGFFDTLRQGQFPVRFIYSLNHGYGYPVTNFLYPLPFYFGSVIHLTGFGFVDSVKIIFGLSVLLSGLFMYLFVKDEWGEKAGLAAAILYSYSPYKIFDLFTRGSLGEMVAFIFPPLIFYLLNKKNVSLAVLTTAALICSHNVIALLFLPVIVGFLVVKKVNFITCILYLGLSAGAAAWFWFPALYDLQFTKAGQIAVSNFRDYWLTANNFWAVLGPIVPMIIIISLIRINEKKFTFLFLITVGSLFFALPVSEIFWKILPLPKLVQFPWRYLAVTIFGASILTGYLLRVANKYLLAAFILVVVLLSWPKIERQYHPESYYVTNDDTTTVQNEYMPKWVTQAISHKAEVKSQKLDEKYAEINTVYFPGVKVFAGERELEVKPSDNGLLLVDSRLDNLHISFGETPLRLAADLASILSVILLIFL